MGHATAIAGFPFHRLTPVTSPSVISLLKAKHSVCDPHRDDATDEAHVSPSVDTARLEAIYRDHFQDVWHAVRRLGGRNADLEDLVQDVFMTFWRSIDRYDEARPLKPWLYGIAFRVVSDYRRKASFSREIPASQREPLVAAGTQSPADAYEQKRRRDLVARALDTLGDEQRVVLVMVDIEGYSVVEVSEALSLKLNTTYSRLRLGRKKFTEAVRRIADTGAEHECT